MGEMQGRGPTGLRFFRVLASDFTTKLKLPSDFIEQQREGERKETATLWSPNGGIWVVDLFKGPAVVYFEGERWKNFVVQINLQEGYVLVFHYERDNFFAFRAFSSTTKEISYPQWTTEKNQIEEETTFFHNAENENSEPSEDIVVISSTDTSSEDEKSDNSSDHTSNPEILREPPLTRLMKRRRDQAQDQDQTSNESKRQSNDNVKPRFEVMIEACNLNRRRRCVEIPAGSKTIHSFLKGKSRAIIKDFKGQMWRVGLFHCRQSSAIYMAEGWNKFGRDMKLKEGDKCIFEVVSEKKMDELMLSIKVITTTQSLEKEVNTEKDNSSPKGVCSTFEAEIKSYNLERSFMYIPAEFATSNGFMECNEVSLRNSSGQMWTARIRYHNRLEEGKARGVYIAGGWLKFAHDNKLMEGDKCIFNIVTEQEKSILEVQIDKRQQRLIE